MSGSVASIGLRIWIILQSTPNCPGCDSPFDDPWLNGDWWEGFTLPYMELMGPVVPAMLGIGIGGILYILTEGRPALPSVVMILIGGFLMGFEGRQRGLHAVAVGSCFGGWAVLDGAERCGDRFDEVGG